MLYFQKRPIFVPSDLLFGSQSGSSEEEHDELLNWRKRLQGMIPARNG